MNLKNTYTEIPNCRALHVRVSQLFDQMFPVVTGTELEPIPFATAVQVFHELLQDLKRAHPNKGDLLGAWKADTRFDKSTLFHEYLIEGIHRGLTTEESHVILNSYLEKVYSLLEGAHAEHSQKKSLTASISATAPDKPSKASVIALAASVLNITPQSLTNLSKNKDAGSTKKSSNKRGQVAAATQGRNPPGKKARGESSGSGSPSLTTNPLICDVIHTNSPKMAPGALRTRLPKLGEEDKPHSTRHYLPAIPYAEARARVAAGACAICLEKGYVLTDNSKVMSNSHHTFGDCLKARGLLNSPQQRHWMNAVVNPWIRAWRDAKVSSKMTPWGARSGACFTGYQGSTTYQRRSTRSRGHSLDAADPFTQTVGGLSSTPNYSRVCLFL